jgi:hypothetical protein
MNKTQLDEIKAREEKATPGPWFATVAHEWEPTGSNDEYGASIDAYPPGVPPHDSFGPVVMGGHGQKVSGAVGVLLNNDAQFIAHAREDVPALVAEIERLKEENAELKTRAELLQNSNQSLSVFITALEKQGEDSHE